MKKLKVTTREIGSVRVFDLEGEPTQDTLQDIAWVIQKRIRRHRMQRIILNLQKIPDLDVLGVRKLIAACIRPQRSLIYGASRRTVGLFEETHLPQNMRICESEKEVVEDLGPFLFDKECPDKIAEEHVQPAKESAGHQFERRRSQRMHVAIPAELNFSFENGESTVLHAIVTNISEGGLFVEFLDLVEAEKAEKIPEIAGGEVKIHILPNMNFREEYLIRGEVLRKEIQKRQLGLAIKFLES